MGASGAKTFRWRRWLLAVACCLSPVCLPAQEVLGEWAEQLVGEDEEVVRLLESLSEEFADLLEEPLNLNTATREQLERFPFLSDEHIEHIFRYLRRYGAMQSEKELIMVEGMDRQTVQCLLPFVCFKVEEKGRRSLTLKQVMRQGKHELTARIDIPLYTRAGYAPVSSQELHAHPDKHYIGYPYRHVFRYRFRYGSRVQAGLTAETDPGEPFFIGQNRKGYDYYSPYLLVRDLGRLKTLALGNYRLNYGLGLVINNDIGMGKTATLSTLSGKGRGIKQHSSTDEFNYLQGAAVSLRVAPRWTLDLFYSFRHMDATADSLFITSLKKDGYHRTNKEYEKKNTFTNQLAGSHLNYNGKYCELGLTAVYNVFNKTLKPLSRSYNRYYPQGREFFNAGIDYKFFWRKFALQGETAVDREGRIAMLNTLSYSPKGGYRVLLMNRFYDMAYQNLYARSVGEGSMVQNESGYYVGLETKLLRYVKMACYGDFFYFPWKKYQVSRNGTYGTDATVQLSYSPTYSLNMFIRYRYKDKQKDYTDGHGDKQTASYVQQKLRYQLTYSQQQRIQLKTTADYVRVGHRGLPASQGYLLAQSGTYRFTAFPLQVNLGAAWFDADDYSARLFLYERGPLYSFSLPSFYGRGMRFTAHVRYEPFPFLLFEAKWGSTCYFNRRTIGSGLEQIDGNTKTDLNLQMRVKF